MGLNVVRKQRGFSGFLFVAFSGWLATSGPFYSNFYYFMVCDHSLALRDEVAAWRKIVHGTPFDKGWIPPQPEEQFGPPPTRRFFCFMWKWSEDKKSLLFLKFFFYPLPVVNPPFFIHHFEYHCLRCASFHRVVSQVMIVYCCQNCKVRLVSYQEYSVVPIPVRVMLVRLYIFYPFKC